jgi:hypothetical protein
MPMFLQNVGICLGVYMAPKPRTKSQLKEASLYGVLEELDKSLV